MQPKKWIINNDFSVFQIDFMVKYDPGIFLSGFMRCTRKETEQQGELPFLLILCFCLHASLCFFFFFLSVCLYTLLNVSTHTHSDCQGAFERDFKRHVLSPQLQETVFLETFRLKIHSKGWNITDQTMMDRNRRTQIKSVCAHLYVCVIRR